MKKILNHGLMKTNAVTTRVYVVLTSLKPVVALGLINATRDELERGST